MENNFIEGQKALERLLSDVRNETVSHAYILEGARGAGKKTAANIFACAVHCTGENKPCGVCSSCVMHAAKTHPDIELVEPEDNGNIKIDAVRSAADELYMRPRVAKKKILIIDGADSMNAAAQNALLKTFEEPPKYGIVMLLSENMQNLLPTIRSRGIKLIMQPFSKEKIKAFVESSFPQMRAKSEFVARYSGGLVGRAVEICQDEEFFSLRAQLFDAAFALTGGKEAIFPAAEVFGVGQRKTDWDHRSRCFDLLLSWLGDVVLLKNGGKIVNADYEEKLREFASKVTAWGAVCAVETVCQTRSGLNASMKYDLWVVNMLISCWRDIHGYSSRN